MENKYYIYIYLDPRRKGPFIYGGYEFEYEPFYIGKGYGDRFLHHLRPYELNKSKGNVIKQNKLNKLLREGYEPIIIKLFDNLIETDALKFEIEIISLIGRIDIKSGVLTNMTDGGDGALGRYITNEFREKQSIIMKEYYSENPIKTDVKDKISESLLNKKMVRSKETREKISKANKGRKYSKKYLNKIIELRKGPKLTHRNKYEITSPTGEIYNILGRDELELFIKENALSLRRLLDSVNKGIINKKGRTTNTKNCYGWKIKKI